MPKKIEDDVEEIETEETDEAEEEFEEEEEYEEEAGGRRFARFLPAAVLSLAVLGFGSLAWHAYRSGTTELREDEILLVEAEKSPLKEKPADPGGLKFPHQDKTIFDNIAAAPAKPAQVERVMPGAEEPAAIAANTPVEAIAEPAPAASAPAVAAAQEPVPNAAELAAKSPASGGPAPASVPAPAVAEDITPAAPEPTALKPAAPETVEVKEVPVQTHAEEPAPAPVKKAETKPAKKPEAAAASGSGTLQLGAFRSEADAKAEWNKLAKKHSVLQGKSPSYVRADLGAKGVFTRLRVGGFKDAKSACAQLSAKGQACMVVAGK